MSEDRRRRVKQLFGEALWVELRESGIDVLVVEPGTVETEFQQMADEIAHSGESPEHVVEVALEALGRQPTVITRWFDWLRMNVGNRLVPRPLATFVARDVIAGWTPEDKR